MKLLTASLLCLLLTIISYVRTQGTTVQCHSTEPYSGQGSDIHICSNVRFSNGTRGGIACDRCCSTALPTVIWGNVFCQGGLHLSWHVCDCNAIATRKALVKCRNPDGNSCSWYPKCLHKYNACDLSSNDEYALNYGNYYCNLYENNINKFTPAGKKFVAGVKKCLQNKLANYVGSRSVSCHDIKKIAFNGHPECYVKNGLCTLPCSDWIEIGKIVKGALLPFSGSAWKTSVIGIQTALGCGKKFLAVTQYDFIGIYISTLKKEVECVKALAGPIISDVIDAAIAKKDALLKKIKDKVINFLQKIKDKAKDSAKDTEEKVSKNAAQSLFDDIKKMIDDNANPMPKIGGK